MDWAGAIEKNRDDLLDIVVRLFVLAGIRTGHSVFMLPRSLRIRLLALLRPAEFAARRLIAVAACKLVTVAVRPVEGRKGPPSRSVILGLETGARQRRAGGEELEGGTDDRTHSVKPETADDDGEKGGIVLHLRESRGVAGMGPRVKPEDDAKGRASRPPADPASLPAFPLFDPFKPFANFWLEPGEDARRPLFAGIAPPPDEPVAARALCRRIRALEQALQDLEGQAARLARWRARRDAEAASGTDRVRPRRDSPLRPGRPPGWRKRPRTALEEVLRECHILAHDAWNTS